jgi:hypothetical protein
MTPNLACPAHKRVCSEDSYCLLRGVVIEDAGCGLSLHFFYLDFEQFLVPRNQPRDGAGSSLFNKRRCFSRADHGKIEVQRPIENFRMEILG